MGDGNTKMRDAARKIGGAVDGINHPQAFGRLAATLFADKTITRKGCSQPRQHEAFDFAVDFSDVILMTFERHRERRAIIKPPLHQRACLARHGLGGEKPGEHHAGNPLLFIRLPRCRGRFPFQTSCLEFSWMPPVTSILFHTENATASAARNIMPPPP